MIDSEEDYKFDLGVKGLNDCMVTMQMFFIVLLHFIFVQIPSFSFELWALTMKTTVVSQREWKSIKGSFWKVFPELINFLMSLQIQNIRFCQVYCECLRTNNQLFLQECLFGVFYFFFPKSCLKVGGVAYTQVFTAVLQIDNMFQTFHFYLITKATFASCKLEFWEIC